MNTKLTLIVSLWLASLNLYAFSDGVNPLKPPSGSDIISAKSIINKMAENPRGPYKQLNWHCNDGTVMPPKAYACSNHEGGHQYATFSDARQTLAAMGWHVGTVYTAMSWEEFWGVNDRQTRMRQLPFERYLIDVDDGWVMRKARYYRGHVQIEDEAYAGQQLLIKLLQEQTWIKDNYLLLRELTRVIPHDGGNDLTRVVRRLSQDIAEQDSSFEAIRIELHTSHSHKTSSVIRRWIEKSDCSSTQKKLCGLAESLANEIDQLYGEQGRKNRLNQLEQLFKGNPKLSFLSKFLNPETQETELESVRKLSTLLFLFRQKIENGISAESKLILFNSIPEVEAELRIKSNHLLINTDLDRKSLLNLTRHLIVASYGGGFLSENEHNNLLQQLDSAIATEKLSLVSYLKLVRSLNLIGNWAVGSLKHTFAEALVQYSSINSHSINFVDDVLRASPILELAEAVRLLSLDAQTVAGVEKKIFNQSVPGILVLNPGIATGRLQILTEADLLAGKPLQKSDIVVLPQTVSELTPVAGVLTQGEGNLLSHVQLLARNFGIPNISITQSIAKKLLPFNQQQVALIAGSDGSVFMQTLASLDEKTKALVLKNSAIEKLTVPQIMPDSIQPIPLSQLSKSLSGKVVGPKAANLGELNKLFPGRVAPALALPFGLFLNEVSLSKETHWQNLANLYQDFRQGTLSEESLNKSIQLLNDKVKGITISSKLSETLASSMKQAFGEADSYGVFIRSDTNVEDLPGFTGAGLSETLPNIVGFEAQVKAIPTVWASVLSSRAIAWRANLLSNPELVFPSVLLMKSVNADKSGVLITSDLVNRMSGLTVSTAWGVGGAVAGESAETWVLDDNGGEQLISEAKVPFKRELPTAGGVQWLPASSGLVLTPSEKQSLRALAKEVNAKYQAAIDEHGLPMPWDIEFGFVKGELTLFQIRPLVERGPGKADRFLESQGIKKQNSQAEIDLTKSVFSLKTSLKNGDGK